MESKKFETSMRELNMIVKKLESDSISLEEAIENFKKGMDLANSCHAKLKEIEKSVHKIINEDGTLVDNKAGE